MSLALSANVENSFRLAFSNLSAHLNSVIEKMNEEGGLLVADEFNLTRLDSVTRMLRVDMEALGYSDAVRNQLAALNALKIEAQEEAKRRGFDKKWSEEFVTNSERATRILLDGATDQLTAVAGQAAEQINQLLKRAVIGGGKASDLLINIQNQLRVSESQAISLAMTSLHSFSSSIRVANAKEAGIKWYAYIGPNELDGQRWQPGNVIREWCHHWEGRRGTIEMFEATALMWGRIKQPGPVMTWRGGYRCRHSFLPLGPLMLKDYPAGAIGITPSAKGAHGGLHGQQ